jgi:hypothetical protein
MANEIPGFELIVHQAEAAQVTAKRAKDGSLMPKQALYHLLGIAAYIREVSGRMLEDLEEGRL